VSITTVFEGESYLTENARMEKNKISEKITPENVADIDRLKQIIAAKKLTQAAVGEAMPEPKTQGHVGHYLMLRRPLTLDIAIDFSYALKVPVSAFSPRLQQRIDLAHQDGSLPASLSKISRLNDDDKRRVIAAIDNIIGLIATPKHDN
jgi:hypothetical protein